jgi:hypothetical protein
MAITKIQPTGLDTTQTYTVNQLTANAAVVAGINVSSYITGAYGQANTGNTLATSSYSQANAANNLARSAYTTANTAVSISPFLLMGA